MGYEYNIRFKVDNTKDLAELLKACPHFETLSRIQNKLQYIYREANNTGQMPNGVAEIETDGIYFCDYGGGEEALKNIIFRVALCYKNLELIDHSD